MAASPCYATVIGKAMSRLFRPLRFQSRRPSTPRQTTTKKRPSMIKSEIYDHRSGERARRDPKAGPGRATRSTLKTGGRTGKYPWGEPSVQSATPRSVKPRSVKTAVHANAAAYVSEPYTRWALPALLGCPLGSPLGLAASIYRLPRLPSPAAISVKQAV